MKTSRLIVKWKNIEKIFEDYDVFQFCYDYEKFVSKSKYKNTELENEEGKAKQELKALSVVYKRDKLVTNKCLYLFRKDSTDGEKIADYLKKHSCISDAQKIKAFDLRDEAKREQYFLKNVSRKNK